MAVATQTHEGFKVGSDGLNFHGDSATHVKIDSNGRLGIGTSSPAYKLHVEGDSVYVTGGSSNSKWMRMYVNDSWSYLTTNGGKYYLNAEVRVDGGKIGSYNDDLQLATSGNTKIYVVDSTGNVGIGTTSPGTKLEVAGQAKVTSLLITNSSSGLLQGHNDAYHGIMFRGYPSSATSYGITPGDQISFYEYGGEFRFYQKNNTGSGVLTEVARIHPTNSFFNSNVGIGTSTPDYPLEVESPEIYIAHFKTTANVNQVVGLEAPSGKNTNLYFYEGSTAKAGIRWDGTNDKFIFKVGNTATDALAITDGGNVGIGTTTPSDGDLGINDPILHVKGPDTSGAYNLVARFQGGNDANDTGAAIAINHSNDRGLLIKAGRKDSDRPAAYFDLIDSNGSTTNMLTMGEYGSDFRTGIGTTSPSHKLDVSGDARVTSHLYSNASMRAPIFYDIDNTSFYLNPAGTTSAILNGKVGIGTTGPDSLLHVAKQGNANGGSMIMGLTGSGTNKWSYLAGTHYNQDTGSGNGSGSAGVAAIGVLSTSTYNQVKIGGGPYEINPATQIEFWTHTATTHTTGGSQRMVINSAGQVGIGTASPGSALHVAGDISIAPTGDGVHIGKYSSSGNVYGNIQLQGNKGGYIDFSTSGTDFRGRILYDASANYMRLDTNGSEKLRIDSSGNVGIGTTSPAHKLDVNGNISGSVIYSRLLEINPASTGNGMSISQNVEGFQYNAEESSADTPRYWLRFNYTNGSSYPYLTNRTPSGDVAIFTGVAAGGNENEHFRIKGGDGTVDAYFTNANVGIGTTSPGATLEVNSTEPQILIKNPVSGTGNAVLKFEEGSGSTQNATITFNQGGQNNLKIATGYQSATDENLIHLAPAGNIGLTVRGGTGSNNGNVGIGTTAPGARLTLNGDGHTDNYQGVLRINNTDSSKWSYVTLPDTLSGNSNSNNYYLIGRGSSISDRVMSFHIPRDNDYGDATQPKFGFYSTGADLLHSIEAETGKTYFKGNVGIGTTSPGYKLDVSGNARVTSTLDVTGNIGTAGNITASGYIGSNTSQTRDKLRVWSSGAYAIGMKSGFTFGPLQNNYAMSFQMNDQNERGFWWGDEGHSDAQGAMALSTRGFLTVAEKIRVGYGQSDTADTPVQALDVSGNAYVSGNVGIGTTSPAVRLDFGNSVNQAFHLYTSGVDYYGINMTQYDSGPYSTNIISGNGGQIKFRTASGTSTQTTRMTVTQTGNVGIGTTSPSYKLHVSGDIGIPQNNSIFFDNTAHYIKRGNSNVEIQGYNGVDLRTNGSSRLFIDQSGRVGIGTTSPSRNFHVMGDIYSQNGSMFLTQGRYITWNSGDNYIKGLSGYHLQFTTYDGVSSQNEVVRMTGGSEATGGARVGIGITEPQAKLSVYASGSAVLDIQGSQGQLFSVTDSLTGSLMSVNDISGLPILEVFDTDKVVMGEFGVNTLVVTGSKVGVGTDVPTGLLEVAGTNGILFSVTDDLSDSLFSVNTVAGLPVIEAFADNTVKIGPFSAPVEITSAGELKVDGGTDLGTAVTGATVSNDTITFTRANGGTFSVTTSDANSNHYVNGLDFSTTDGVLTLDRAGLTALTVDLDGRYLTETLGDARYAAAGGAVDTDFTANELSSQGNTLVGGSLLASGDVVAYSTSDRRLKDNLTPISNACEKVQKLTGYEFDWNSKQDIYTGRDIGVVAQEVEEVLPEIVKTRDSGYKAVDYEKLVAVLIEANKELQDRVQTLEDRIDGLTK